MKAVTVLVLLTVSAVFSQPESFRSLSTSGMILDGTRARMTDRRPSESRS